MIDISLGLLSYYYRIIFPLPSFLPLTYWLPTPRGISHDWVGQWQETEITIISSRTVIAGAGRARAYRVASCLSGCPWPLAWPGNYSLSLGPKGLERTELQFEIIAHVTLRIQWLLGTKCKPALSHSVPHHALCAVHLASCHNPVKSESGHVTMATLDYRLCSRSDTYLLTGSDYQRLPAFGQPMKSTSSEGKHSNEHWMYRLSL